VRVGSIGKNAGKETSIHCGIDFAVLQEKIHLNGRLHIVSLKLGKLREALMMGVMTDTKTRMEMMDLLRKLEKEKEVLTGRIWKLMSDMKYDETATIDVSGEISKGTLLEICQVSHFVDEPLRKVCVSLDRTTRKIIWNPL
jgi:hypothetical protein